MTFRIHLFVLIVLAACLTACTSQSRNPVSFNPIPFEPITSADIKPVVATFKTTVNNPTGSKHDFVWTLIRSADKIEVLRTDNGQSEIWSRTSKDLWYYEKAFHDDRAVVQYSPVDLKSLGIEPQWMNAATAVNPKILEALSPGRAGKPFLGHSSAEFKGQIEHTEYSVSWLQDMALPAEIVQKNAANKVDTQLVSIEPLTQTNTAFSDILSYRLIDYSDLGDMERDPFVRKIQHSLPAHHAHEH